MFRYVAICIALACFCQMDFVGNISQAFSKTVVYLTGGFADAKRLAFGADDAVNHTGRRTGKVRFDVEGLVNVCASTTEVMLAGESARLLWCFV